MTQKVRSRKREGLHGVGQGLLKAYKICFNMGQQMTKGTLDYIHADLWDPSPTPLHSSTRYLLPIIDDYLRHRTVAGTPQHIKCIISKDIVFNETETARQKFFNVCLLIIVMLS